MSSLNDLCVYFSVIFVAFLLLLCPSEVSSQSGGVVNYSGAIFNGAFTTWVSNPSAFCNCNYGGPCVYVCAGGGAAGNAQNCDPNACSSGQYSFSANNGFQIQVSQTGSPYRAFGYAELCGQNKQNTACLSNGAVFTMSFMLKNAASWTGYVKLLFFGDGNNLIGYWPSVGSGAGTGKNSLIIFPNGDLPTQWQAAIPLLDSVWYDVTVTINNFGSMTMSIVENAPTGRVTYSGSGYTNTATISAAAPPQFGCYTWANTAGPQFSVSVNNICAGNAGSCAFTYSGASASTSTTTAPSSSTASTSTSSTSKTTTTTKATTTTPISSTTTTAKTTTTTKSTTTSSSSSSSTSSTSISSSTSLPASTTTSSAFASGSDSSSSSSSFPSTSSLSNVGSSPASSMAFGIKPFSSITLFTFILAIGFLSFIITL